MTPDALVELLRLLDDAGIPVWLDGGWGVDALLGEQTRPHKDVDVVVPLADIAKLREILGRRGFAIREGKPPDAFVLVDAAGLEIDVHAVVFDSEGNGVHQMERGGDWIFPAEGFSGRGTVAGTAVRCLSPTTAVLCHAHGYVPQEKDLRDMERLRERFGVELPPQLRRGAT